MSTMSALIRTSAVRVGAMALAAAFAIGAGVAPASAADNGKHLGWYKNGKAEEKERRREQAARLNDRTYQNGSSYVYQGGTRVYPQRQRRYNNNTRVYDYRNSRVNPYAGYPQYNSNGYYNNGGYYNNNGYYGNNSYYGYSPSYSNRRGSLNSNEVAERAARSGYSAGFQRGQYDAANRNRPNPQGHGAYQYAYDGFDPDWGSASTYQSVYRQYFVRGYQDAYNRSGYNTRYSRRW